MDLKVFHKTFILSLDKRGNDGVDLAKQVKKFGGKSEILLVGDGVLRKPKSYFRIDTNKPTNWTGNRQTYNYMKCWMDMLRQAKELSLKNFLFLEDDAKFIPDFSTRFDILYTDLMKAVPYWDMLYLGSNQIKEDSLWGYKGLKTQRVSRDNPYILRSARARDMHAVAVNNTMYDKLLAMETAPWLPQNPSYDEAVCHSLHWQNKIYAFQPSLVIQKPGFSYNRGTYDDRTHTW